MKKFYIQLTLLFIFVSINTVFSQEKEKIATQTFAYRSADPHGNDPYDWQANLDAVIAAPNNHKILMENDIVRVMEVTVAPGET